MSEGHSLFAPSSAKRVIDCPASLLINAALPDSSSIYAEEGTVAHKIADECFKTGNQALTYAGRVYEVDVNGVKHDIVVDDAMVGYVQDFLDRAIGYRGDHYGEHRVDISRWCPSHYADGRPMEPQSGTLDRMVCLPGSLIITDLKYGQGVQVWAQDNPQGVQYALGAYDAYNWAYQFKSVTIVIDQPRLDHYDAWTLTVDELLQRGTEIKKRYIEALKPDAPFGPSVEACKFCKISGRCPAESAKIASDRAMQFDDLDLPAEPLDLIPLSELAYTWNVTRPLWKNRMDAIERVLNAELLAGRRVPGAKLVEGRAHRRWFSPDAAVTALKKAGVGGDSQYAPRELITPAQAQKLVGKARTEKYLKEAIYKPPGAPTIVDEHDPRQPFGSRNAGQFDDLDEDWSSLEASDE